MLPGVGWDFILKYLVILFRVYLSEEDLFYLATLENLYRAR